VRWVVREQAQGLWEGACSVDEGGLHPTCNFASTSRKALIGGCYVATGLEGSFFDGNVWISRRSAGPDWTSTLHRKLGVVWLLTRFSPFRSCLRKVVFETRTVEIVVSRRCSKLRLKRAVHRVYLVADLLKRTLRLFEAKWTENFSNDRKLNLPREKCWLSLTLLAALKKPFFWLLRSALSPEVTSPQPCSSDVAARGYGLLSDLPAAVPKGKSASSDSSLPTLSATSHAGVSREASPHGHPQPDSLRQA
jgi:hypothetical protein